MDLPPQIELLLSRFTARLAATPNVAGLYLYGSLTTGDFSPARSDIDLIAVTDGELGEAAMNELHGLHSEVAELGLAARRLHCLYVPDGRLGDPEPTHPYWYGDRFTRWQVKVITRAELLASGRALYGTWPPAGLGSLHVPDLQAAVRAEVDSYWRRMAARRRPWLYDAWVDFGLITLPRAAAVLAAGELITKSQAISRLEDFGVPARLAEQIRLRRAGSQVSVSPLGRVARARLTRKLMIAGIRQLTAQDEPRSPITSSQRERPQ